MPAKVPWKEALAHELTESPHQPGPATVRWTVICYALSDTARTVRLCAIMLAIEIPPGLLALLLRR